MARNPPHARMADQYDIALTVAPTEARADQTSEVTLTATVTALSPGLSVKGLQLRFNVTEGDAYFPNDKQAFCADTDISGTAQITLKCGVPGKGYAQAMLSLSETDKKSSNEVRYLFADGFPALDITVWELNAFADGVARVGIRATVTDSGMPTPDAHLRFKLLESSATFVNSLEPDQLEMATNDDGTAVAGISAQTAHTGYVLVSLISDPNIRKTVSFTFIPKGKLELRLVHDGAPADGKSPITALATVTDAQTARGMEDIALLFVVFGDVTPVGVESLGGQIRVYTDKDGHGQISFTSTTPSSDVQDIGWRLATVMTLADFAPTGYGASEVYTFR